MHDPKIVEMVARAMACHFSMNRMPHMSGDPLNRLGSQERRRLDDATTAALDALAAAGRLVPPDWVAVPREPTREMLEELSIHVEPGDGYRMMLIVSPLAKEDGA